MKKIVTLLFAGLFMFGCSSAKQETCPRKEADAETRGVEKEGFMPSPDTKPTEAVEEAPEPASTGYGEDPGEETQE